DFTDFTDADLSGGSGSDWTITGTNDVALKDGTANIVDHLSFTATTPTGYEVDTNWEFDTRFTGTGGKNGTDVYYITEAAVLVQAGAVAPTASFGTASINESATDTAENVLTVAGDTFGLAGALTVDTHYTISGLPTGVTVSSFNSASDGGTTATLTLAGTPTTPLTANETITVVIKAAALTGALDSGAATFDIADEVVVATPSPSSVDESDTLNQVFTITLTKDQLTAASDADSIEAAITLGGDLTGLTKGTVEKTSLSVYTIQLTGDLDYSTGSGTITLAASQLMDSEDA
ncbi:unnamed protein product, partial [marine sediment metagenome]